MKHTYRIEGVTCNNCVDKVTQLLSGVNGITKVEIAPTFDTITLHMDTHVDTTVLNNKLSGTKYKIGDEVGHSIHQPAQLQAEPEEKKSTLRTYAPVLLLFGYIIGATLLLQLVQHHFNWMQWMSHFMGGFFLAFSYFKLLDIPAFASSYSSYDVVAQKWYGYGYVYPFIELMLGLLFITGLHPVFANTAAFVVMGVSTIGVVNSLMKKRKFQCACMGAVFNLPMSTITLIEDLLMVLMSGIALLIML
jgi:copper chaperone CopZ